MAGDAKARVILEAQRRGEGAFTSFQADLGKIAARAALVGAAAAAALAVVTKRAFENIDALAKEADILSIATEKLAGFQLGAKLAGVDNEQLNKALERQRKTIFDASNGLSTATRALAQLGLKADDLMKLSLDEQFLTISEALSKVENATIRGGVAADIFGSRNQKLLALINEGRAGIEGYAEQADRLGLAVNRVDAAKIEQANDAFELAKDRVQGLGNIIAIELAPHITALSNAFTNAGGDADEMGATVRKVIDGIIIGAGYVADAFYGWRLIFQGVKIGSLELSAKIVDDLADVVDAVNVARQKFADMLDFADEVKLAAKVLLAPSTVTDADVAAANAARAVEPLRNTLREVEQSLQASSDDAQRVFQELAAATKPSEAIASALATARAEAQKAAEATAALRQQAIDVAGSEPGGESDVDRRAREQAEKAAERQREQLEKDLEQVRQFTLTREQVEIEATQRRLEILRTSHEQGLIDQERFYELSAEVAIRGQQRLNEIEAAGLTEREKFERLSARRKAETVLGTLTAITAGAAQHNKKLFELNKALGIAEAVVNTARGVTQALAAYPPPLSFVMAAAVAAAGFAQVQAIRSTTFQGGGAGTTPSLAGSGGGVVNSTPVDSSAGSDRSGARGSLVLQVTIQGSVIGEGGRTALAEDLARLLREHTERTDDVLIDVQSRNGLQLAGAA